MTQLPFVDGAYRTAPRPVSWLARTLPSLFFHSRFFTIGFRAGLTAKWSHYGDREWIQSSLKVLRALENVGVQFEITGIEHLQQLDTPCLVVGNHMSTLETAVLPGIIQPVRKVTFVVKSSLLEYPVFKHVMRSRDPISVSQTNPRQDLKAMLAGGMERLNKGISIIIFPQGARTTSFDPAQFNTIGIKLAQRAGVPIVPLALASDAWAMGKYFPDFGKIDPTKKVHFAFGEPLWVQGRGTQEHEAIIQFIRQKLHAWQEKSEAARDCALSMTNGR